MRSQTAEELPDGGASEPLTVELRDGCRDERYTDPEAGGSDAEKDEVAMKTGGGEFSARRVRHRHRWREEENFIV